MAYKQKGWSPFTQKSKSGKKDEDRQKTFNEISQGRQDKYDATMDSLEREDAAGNLRKGEFNRRSIEEFNKAQALNQASHDSITNIINKENIEIKKQHTAEKARVDSTNKARKQALKDYNAGKLTMNEAKAKGVVFK